MKIALFVLLALGVLLLARGWLQANRNVWADKVSMGFFKMFCGAVLIIAWVIIMIVQILKAGVS